MLNASNGGGHHVGAFSFSHTGLSLFIALLRLLLRGAAQSFFF
jgi:hypothetical protein